MMSSAARLRATARAVRRTASRRRSAKRATRGAEAFDAFFSEMFGARWPALRAALERPRAPVARINGFAEPSAALAQLPAGSARRDELAPAVAFSHDAGFAPPRPCAPGVPGVLAYYLLDGGSVRAALALLAAADAVADERVLDMCAAPGGKTLALLDGLRSDATVVANEPSRPRRARLARALDAHLPARERARVRVRGRDARRWGRARDGAANDDGDDAPFDRVLVDAPCSSERHVLLSADELARWTRGRVSENARRQAGLLVAALDAVRVGGCVVYSTCALASAENDGVVARALRKRPGRARAVPPSAGDELGEPTEYGRHILPDRDHGWGPIYYAVLRRVS